MSDPETPLVLSFLYEIRRPVVFGLWAFGWLAQFNPVFPLIIVGVSPGALAIWWFVRWLNRRDAPDSVTPPVTIQNARA